MLIVRHDGSRVGTPARFGTRSSSTSNVATVRENKWEHGMETHVGAEANVPKLESIGLSIWSGDKTISVRHDGSTCRSSAPPPADQSQQGTRLARSDRTM